MKPQPMLTVRFVKRLLLVLVVVILLNFTLPTDSSILWYMLGGALLLVIIALQIGSPRLEITVDEDNIRFNRIYPNWNPLKKYHLQELIIPHTGWNRWIKVTLSDEEGGHQNFYLFFLNERLCFSAETKENSDLEYWVQKKFPDRPLGTTFSFKSYRDQYDRLKERNRTRVF